MAEINRISKPAYPEFQSTLACFDVRRVSRIPGFSPVTCEKLATPLEFLCRSSGIPRTSVTNKIARTEESPYTDGSEPSQTRDVARLTI